MYYIYNPYNQDVLCHHGIKGQRWGVRRFQDVTGSLTEAGRKRYDKAKRATKFGVALAKAKGEHYAMQAKNSTAYKRAKFDVALAKAKGEHYAKEAHDQYIDVRNKSINAYRHTFKDNYYWQQNKQRTWDYIYQKGTNNIRIENSKWQAEKAKSFIKEYQSALLDETGLASEVDSIGRHQQRSGWDMSWSLDNVPKDISSMSLSELRTSSGSTYQSISERGARYLDAQKDLESIRWQDYFEPATSSSYNPYEY